MFNIPSVIDSLDTQLDSAYLIIDKSDVLMIYKKKEIDLLIAEILWKVGSIGEAKEYLLNASVGAVENYNELTNGNFEEALLKERQRILIGSGQRFFDLLRFNKIENFIPFYRGNDIEAGAGFWPLSLNTISTNNLIQNDYWGK